MLTIIKIKILFYRKKIIKNFNASKGVFKQRNNYLPENSSLILKTLLEMVVK